MPATWRRKRDINERRLSLQATETVTAAVSRRPSHRRILVASPIEPSGASWLLNCFLELNIRVDHKPVVDRVWRGSTPPPAADRMWIPQGGDRFALDPRAGVLMKFLPALAARADFQFRADVSVEYVQDFPLRQLGERPRVLMIRDPRDALYSSYCRATPALTFAEYLRFPNPSTLLDRSSHWALFVAAWLAQPNIRVVRFEDYKRDAYATLRAILADLELNCADPDIEVALRLSSFERAQEVEQAIRGRFPNDRQIANRSGTVGEARNETTVKALIPDIEAATATALRALGYATDLQGTEDTFAAARLSAAFLSAFANFELPRSVASAPKDPAGLEDGLCKLLAFANRLDVDVLRQANLPPAEARVLLDSLAEFMAGFAQLLASRLASTRSELDDGSNYFFQRIREIRRSRRSGPGPQPVAGASADSEE